MTKTYFYLRMLILISLVLFSIEIDCSNNTIPINDCFTLCRKNYFGALNYYNMTTEKCESSAICKEEEEYDIITNTCFIRGEDDLGNITINNTNPDDDQSNKEDELTPPKINCVNGYYPPNSSLCICYPGWISKESSNDNNEIIKCSISTDLNSTKNNSTNGNEEAEVSTSNLSLILTIVIPTVIGLILIIVVITCIKTKCRKSNGKKKNESENCNDRPIIIHLSNDASERMQIKDGDNLSSLQRLGYCTPRRVVTNQIKHRNTQNYDNNTIQYDNHHQYNNHYNNTARQMKRAYTYKTPDKKRNRIPRPPMTSINKERNQHHLNNQALLKKRIQWTNEDNNDWINNNNEDDFTLSNNQKSKYMINSNPNKRLKATPIYSKPNISPIINAKSNILPRFNLSSIDDRLPTVVYKTDNISDFNN